MRYMCIRENTWCTSPRVKLATGKTQCTECGEVDNIEYKLLRCNCDASCAENRYHWFGDFGCMYYDTPPSMWPDWAKPKKMTETPTNVDAKSRHKELLSHPAIKLAIKRNRLKAEVLKWMAAEGTQGRLRNNSQAPMWDEYEKAEKELAIMLHELGTGE